MPYQRVSSSGAQLYMNGLHQDLACKVRQRTLFSHNCTDAFRNFGHTINRAASASRNWRLLDGNCVVGVNVEKDFGDERIENGGVDHVIHQHCSDALKAKDNEFDLTEKVVVSRMHAV